MTTTLDNTASADEELAPESVAVPEGADKKWRKPLTETARGLAGRGGGAATVVSAPIEYQSTTTQACGLNPWMVGAAAPLIGTPLGVHATTGEGVCCDPMSWFAAGIISNPSAFVLSLPGLGKSSLIRKMLLGAVARGQVPIVSGDIKGEYVDIVRAVGGQVIQIGHGLGHLNPLGAGVLGKALAELEANRDHLEKRGQLRLIEETKASIHARQVTMVGTLIQLVRQSPVADVEYTLISVALRELRSEEGYSFEDPPLLVDVARRIEAGSAALRQSAVAADDQEYRATMRPLVQSLRSLLDGVLGDIFADHTTFDIDLGAPAVCIDVSSIDREDTGLKAAVMMSCWSDSYGSMEASHLLSDAGLRDRQTLYMSILDELWQTLGAAPALVDRIDELTRLNRTDGVSLIMVTHTGRDLESLPTEADVKTAMGFIERAGMLISGGLPSGELDRLSDVLQFTKAEARMITSWSRGAPIMRRRGDRAATPLGRGRFMIKSTKDGSPGIPIRTIMTNTEIELGLHDTAWRFADLHEGKAQQ